MGSVVVIERSDRTFVRVHGRDPVKMVQGLITNDLARADEQHAVPAALLTPKGKMIAEVRAFRRGPDVLLETATGALDALLAHFKKFVPPLFARFEPAPHYSIVGLYGAGSADIVQNVLGVQAPAQEDASTEAAGVTVIRTHYAGDPGFDLLVTGDQAALMARLEEAGARRITAAALDVLRVQAGTPAWGAELDDNVIPLEAGLRTRMISETKGCYTGQEIIIRILHRGHVNWQLRGLLLGAVEPPARGTQLLNAEGKAVARITSAVRSPQAGQTIALGYARRELTLPARLHWEGGQATVVALPFEGEGGGEGDGEERIREREQT